MAADHHLFGGGHHAPRLIGEVFHAGGKHCTAMGARQQPEVAEFVKVLANGLGRDVEALRQIFHRHAAKLP